MIKAINCSPNKPCKLNLEPIKVPSDCTSFTGSGTKMGDAITEGIMNSKAFNKVKAKILTGTLIIASWFAAKSIFQVVKGNQKKG